MNIEWCVFCRHPVVDGKAGCGHPDPSPERRWGYGVTPIGRFAPVDEVLVTSRRWGEALWTAPDLAWLQEAQSCDVSTVIALAGRRVGLPDHRRFSPESAVAGSRSA